LQDEDQDTSNKQGDQAPPEEDNGVEMDDDFDGDVGDVGGLQFFCFSQR
jgi:hypothetical protein